MAGTVTVTGVVGAAVAITAKVFTNVASYKIDCVNNLLTLTFLSDPIQIISISAATTITATKSSSTYVLTIS